MHTLLWRALRGSANGVLLLAIVSFSFVTVVSLLFGHYAVVFTPPQTDTVVAYLYWFTVITDTALLAIGAVRLYRKRDCLAQWMSREQRAESRAIGLRVLGCTVIAFVPVYGLREFFIANGANVPLQINAFAWPAWLASTIIMYHLSGMNGKRATTPKPTVAA